MTGNPLCIGVDASRAVSERPTGTERYSRHLIGALIAQDRLVVQGRSRTLRWRLYFNRPPASSSLFTDHPHVEHRVIPFPRLWTHLRLGWEVAHHPPDLLFVPAHVLPLWTRPPALVTVHDLGYRHFPEAHPPGQRWYLEWSTRHNARRAAAILADSEATRADLTRHYGTDPDRIVVAYPGLDPTLAPARDPQRIARTLARYGIRRPYLLYLGTLQPRKNLVRLVEAFARLQSRLDPDDRGLSLVLAGRRGWLYDGLFRRVRTLGLEGRVLFPGYVDDADKAALLSGALAFVFPSLYEGFGFPVLEAQVCGTPVVCSDRSSLPEVAGDAALLVDPMDVEALAAALYRVVTEPGLRATLIERGRANVRRFSWESCAQTVLEVMGRVLDEERRAKAT